MRYKYNRRQLHAFIGRAKTPEQIEIASDWFDAHISDQKLYEELQISLTSRLADIRNEMRREAIA